MAVLSQYDSESIYINPEDYGRLTTEATRILDFRTLGQMKILTSAYLGTYLYNLTQSLSLLSG